MKGCVFGSNRFHVCGLRLMCLRTLSGRSPMLQHGGSIVSCRATIQLFESAAATHESTALRIHAHVESTVERALMSALASALASAVPISTVSCILIRIAYTPRVPYGTHALIASRCALGLTYSLLHTEGGFIPSESSTVSEDTLISCSVFYVGPRPGRT